MHRTIRRIVTFGFIPFLLVVGLLTYVVRSSCYDILPIHDSDVIVRLESAELLHGATAAFQDDSTSVSGEELVRPTQVISISGKTATLALAHRMYAGNLQFAQAWQRTYSSHHGGNSCVQLELVWSSGKQTQHCCVGDI
ncbi:MAG: hypothetical protein ABI186_10110 [Candidatus Elarobacter sp.]